MEGPVTLLQGESEAQRCGVGSVGGPGYFQLCVLT